MVLLATKAIQQVLLLQILVAAAAAAQEAGVPSSNIHHGEVLIEWLRNDCQGYFNPKVEIRQFDATTYGMLALEDLAKDETVMEIPRKCVLFPRQGHVGDRIESYFEDLDETFEGHITVVHKPKDGSGEPTYDILFDDGDTDEGVDLDYFDFVSDSLSCSAVRTLVEEMELGDKSRFSAYVQYLNDTQEEGQLPAVWSEAAQDLLAEVVGPALPPYVLFDWIKEDWYGNCNGEKSAEHAASLVNQRSWDETLIPVYDMINHRNGRWLNTDSDTIRESEKVIVKATRPIQAQEQLYISYNFCLDCDGRYENYGTPEVLRDYGFVEAYPRRFVLPDQEIGFDLDTGDDGKLELRWIRGQGPSESTARQLETEIRRLLDLNETAFTRRDERVSDREWSVITEYLDALVEALQYAWKAVTEGIEDGAAVAESTCVGAEEAFAGTCGVAASFERFYHPLQDQDEEWVKDRDSTCNGESSSMYNWNEGWENVRTVESHYQTLEWEVNRNPPAHDTKDACLTLDTVIQICETYRPHYHEMIVHYTARFIENVKRVCFVGGGDSMLLHEILKYPSLEKVVGLELDQQVVRGSFRHFGTQPHFDNDKVEWWFGDASKSLLMLPKEYFGSFDMIFVDLSESVTSASVTDELDIMQALTLLLAADGIFLKNEVAYFSELKDIFPHTVHLSYDFVPVICLQSLILGSKLVSFLSAPLYDHKVDYLYKVLDGDRFDVVHDYQWNTTAVDPSCRRTKRDDKTIQVASPGIMMVLEAEDASSILLQSATKLETSLQTALKEQGLSVVTTKILRDGKEDKVLFMVFKEGYVVARSSPENSYCGFDVLLWSSFAKMAGIETALAAAVESRSASSYRIVTGGMFGVSTWKDDQDNLGPDAARTECSSDTGSAEQEPRSGTPVDKKTSNLVLDKFAGFFTPDDTTIAVLCGRKEEPCGSLDVLKNHTKLDLLPLWTCDELTDVDGSQAMFVCQKSLHTFLERELSEEKKLGGIVVDDAASYTMGRVVHNAITSKYNAKRWFYRDAMTVISLLSGGQGDEWRRNFVDSVRKDVIVTDPVFSSEVVLKSTEGETTLGVALTSSGNKHFNRQLVDILADIDANSGLSGEIPRIRGGEFRFTENDEFLANAQSFTSDDYKNEAAARQWWSQKPLGYQNVYQLKGPVDGCSKIVGAVATVLSKLKVDGIFTEEISLSDGDGCLVTARWNDGHLIALWDGKQQVDVNLYFVKEDEELANDFGDSFGTESSLEVALRDIQPRGSGRVVSFQSDLDEVKELLWTTSSTTAKLQE